MDYINYILQMIHSGPVIFGMGLGTNGQTGRLPHRNPHRNLHRFPHEKTIHVPFISHTYPYNRSMNDILILSPLYPLEKLPFFFAHVRRVPPKEAFGSTGKPPAIPKRSGALNG